MNWIDFAIIAILLIFVIIGVWKGFAFSILSMFSGTVNFIISIFLVRPTTNLLNSWFGFENALTNGFTSKLSSMSTSFDVNMVGMSKDEISTHISNTLDTSGFPLKNLFKSMLKITPEKIEGKTSCTLNEIISKSLGSFFSLVITFIVIFVLLYVVLFLIGKIAKKSQEVSGIRTIDRILGFFFGLIRGAIFISLIFAVLSLFNENGALSGLFDYIHASKMGNWAYSNINYIIDKYVNFKAIADATFQHNVI